MGASSIMTPVLIVGGGPVGLTLAIDLAHRGIKSIVIEERSEPMAHPKATLLGARSMELFRRWGMDRSVYDAAIPADNPYYIIFTTRLAGQELYRVQSPSIREMMTRDPVAAARFAEMRWSPYGKTQIGQQALEPVLLAKVAELGAFIDLRQGWRCERFTQDADGVTGHVVHIETDAKEDISALYLANCEGGVGPIRRQLGIRRNGRGKMRSNVSLFFRSKDFLEVHGRGLANLYFVFTPDCFGVFTAIDGEELWNFQYYFLDPARQAEPIDPEAILFRAMGKPFDFELLNITHWSHHQSVARKWRDDRVFLLGDSAHLFAPTGGVGMNTGIGDACDLAWKLEAVLKGWGGPRLLDSYERERKPIAVRNSIVSATNSDKTDMVMDETPEGIDLPGEAAALDRAELGRKIRWLSRQFSSAGVHLGYRYVASDIIVADGTLEPADDPSRLTPSTWPGSRAPHAWLDDGRSTLDLVGDIFVLLVLANETTELPSLIDAFAQAGVPVRVERIADPEIAALYEQPFVLVRPDGHVGWRGAGEPDDPAAIVRTLTGW
ncbi:FAD-monooxygenase [Sphingopyxis lindanitolerans]|uniref:FAD-monooxygenase n=2 Tax=Sphingopyxis lindanitolerans TaxID=2054227 RepID=A0A2S8B9N9_9SPHN|nr:FAD-monooxygenase [Sphingopyxis lindanitolerans]